MGNTRIIGGYQVSCVSGWRWSLVDDLGRNYFPVYHPLKAMGEVGPGDLALVDGACSGRWRADVQHCQPRP